MLFDHGVFTSESVSSGHPDKLCDQISDAIVDAFLARDPWARAACDVLAAGDRIDVVGEFRTNNPSDFAAVEASAEQIVRDTLRAVGYGDTERDIDPETCTVNVRFRRQSAEIGSAVDGDQGMVFSYATDETDALIPLSWVLARDLLRTGEQMRQLGALPLRPDANSQVMVRYRNGRPVAVTGAVLSWQHEPDWPIADMREALERAVVDRAIPDSLRDADEFTLRINPSGVWTQGGPLADAGLTGRKIVVDTYGGACPNGGGAFSGKDSSKVDRAGAYAARRIARHVVSAGLARRCTIEIAYAIGTPAPVSLRVELHGTGAVSEEVLEDAIGEAFDLTPAGMIRELALDRPIYYTTAREGHFGEADGSVRTWETDDRIEDLLLAVRHRSGQHNPVSGPTLRPSTYPRASDEESAHAKEGGVPSRWHVVAHDELTDAPGRMEARVIEARYLGANTWELSSGGSDFFGESDEGPTTEVVSTDKLLDLLATFDEGWEPPEWEHETDEAPLSPMLQSLLEIAERVGATDCARRLRGDEA